LFKRRDYRNEGHNPFALGKCPSKSGSCSSETKCDKKTALKPKLFVLKRRLQEQRPHSTKYILGSCPGEGVSCSLVTMHRIKRATRPKSFVSMKSLQNQRPQQ
jgi:hypothetical protein